MTRAVAAYASFCLLLGGCAPSGALPGTPRRIETPTIIVSATSTEGLLELLVRADAEVAAEHYETAATLYQRAFDADAVGTYRPAALFGLGNALDRGAHPQRALAVYERLYGLEKPGFVREGIGVRITRLLTYLERYREAEARARGIEPAGRAPLEQVALGAARALGALERSDEESAERDLNRARAALDPLGIDHLDRVPLDFAAWSFARGELAKRQAERIVFSPPSADFADTLERRCVLILRAQSAYSDAMRAHSAHYSAMAGVRVGELYQKLHGELTRMPPPASARTVAQRQLVQGALRLRYAVLLDTASTMLSATLQMVDRTGEGQAWAERARTSLAQLRQAQLDEERALAALPFSRADLEKALRDLSARVP